MASVLRRRLRTKLKSLMGNQTQEVFAAKIGIGQGSLNRILKGNQDVGLDMLERISQFTGVSVELLIGDAILLDQDSYKNEGLPVPESSKEVSPENGSNRGLCVDLTVTQG